MPIKGNHLASIKEQINPNIKTKSPTKQFTKVNQSSSQEDATIIENTVAVQAIADLKTDADKLSVTDPEMAAQINEGLARWTDI